jgi:hypothetical protein
LDHWDDEKGGNNSATPPTVFVLFIAATSILLQAAFPAIVHPRIEELPEVLSLLTGKGLGILQPGSKILFGERMAQTSEPITSVLVTRGSTCSGRAVLP